MCLIRKMLNAAVKCTTTFTERTDFRERKRLKEQVHIFNSDIIYRLKFNTFVSQLLLLLFNCCNLNSNNKSVSAMLRSY